MLHDGYDRILIIYIFDVHARRYFQKKVHLYVYIDLISIYVVNKHDFECITALSKPGILRTPHSMLSGHLRKALTYRDTEGYRPSW